MATALLGFDERGNVNLQTQGPVGGGGTGNSIGEVVQFSKAGTVTSLRYLQQGANTPTVTVNFYRRSDAALLASGSAVETSDGNVVWMTVDVPDVAVAAGVEYIIAVYNSADLYVFDWQTDAVSPVVPHDHADGLASLTRVGVQTQSGGNSYPSTFLATRRTEIAVGAVLVYNDAPGAPGAPSVSPNPVNTTGTVSWSAASDPDGDVLTYDVELSTNNGASYSVIAAGVSGTSTAYNFVSQPSTSVAFLRVRAKDTSGVYGPYATGSAFTIQHNVAPNAPGSLAPAGNQTVERTQQQRLSWVFSDPDGGDSQSKFDLQYRLDAGAWTVVTQTTNATYYDAPANTFPDGSIEWQVRTYDAQGVVSPYSSSAFFTAAVTPGLPIITSPANNSTISTSASVVTWSAPSQEAFQVQTASDAAGTVVYTDSGEVISATARDRGLVFGTNNRTEVIRLRIKNSGLWSGWSTATVNVSFTAPEVPSVALVPSSSSGSITVGVTAPKGNLLTTNQASAETDTTGFIAGTNASISRSTAQSFNGSASLAVTALAAGNMVAGTVATIPVTAGQVYTGLLHARAATTGRAFNVRVQFVAQDGTTVLGTFDGATWADNAAGWTQGVTTAQAPAGSAFAFVRALVLSAAASEVHYVDAVGLYETPTGNLVPGGGDFENGTAGWTAQGNVTVAASTVQSYTGRQSLAATVTGTATYSGPTNSNVGPVTSGVTYTASAWVYTTVARKVRLALARATIATFAKNSSDDNGIDVPANTWTRLVATGTAPGAGTMQVQVDTGGGSQSGTGVLYVDAVQVVVGSAPVDYLPPTTHNLVTNPSVEVGTTGWSPSAAITGARVTTDAYVGTACYQATQNTASDPNVTVGGTAAVASRAPVVAGLPYTYSVYVKAAVGQSNQLRVIGRSASDGVVTDTVGTAVAGTGQWQRLIYTFVPAATVTGAELRVQGDTNVGDVWLTDAVQLEAGSVATPYVDGSLGAGYRWDASENLLSAAASSFEDGTTGLWSVNGATIANSTTSPASGTKSLAVTLPATSFPSTATPTVQAVAGATYTFSGTITNGGSSTRPFYWQVEWVNASSGGTVNSDPAPIAANSGRRVIYTATAPPGATGVVLRAVWQTAGTAGEVFYIDAVQVEQRPYATPYDSTGTANASTSTRQFPWTIPTPAITGVDVYRRLTAEGGDGIRIATGVSLFGGYTDYTVASLTPYSYRAVALGANGTNSSSAWAE